MAAKTIAYALVLHSKSKDDVLDLLPQERRSEIADMLKTLGDTSPRAPERTVRSQAQARRGPNWQAGPAYLTTTASLAHAAILKGMK